MANEKKVKETSHGLNTAGKVLGILSIVFAAIFISAPLGLFLGIIGLVLAIAYKVKGGEKASGLVLTIIGTAISIFMTALFVIVIGAVVKIVVNGLIGDWSCMTREGHPITINIDTDGYNVDGKELKLNELEIENLNISTTDGIKSATVTLKSSDDVIYTCVKH